MTLDTESELLNFCAAQHEEFCADRWVGFDQVTPREFGDAALFLSGTDWFGHRQGLSSVAERLLLPYEEMNVAYVREEGAVSTIFLDPNDNDTLASMHPDYRENALAWEGFEYASDFIDLRVLTSVDLDVSKIACYSEQDRADILTLARHRLIDSRELQSHASEALEHCVEDTKWVIFSLNEVCTHIAAISASSQTFSPT